MLLIGRQTDYGDAQAGLEIADDHTRKVQNGLKASMLEDIRKLSRAQKDLVGAKDITDQEQCEGDTLSQHPAEDNNVAGLKKIGQELKELIEEVSKSREVVGPQETALITEKVTEMGAFISCKSDEGSVEEPQASREDGGGVCTASLLSVEDRVLGRVTNVSAPATKRDPRRSRGKQELTAFYANITSLSQKP